MAEKTLLRIHSDENFSGNVNFYYLDGNVYFHYDGRFDPDDPEDQTFIRAEFTEEQYRAGIADLKQTGRCFLGNELEITKIRTGAYRFIYHWVSNYSLSFDAKVDVQQLEI